MFLIPDNQTKHILEIRNSFMSHLRAGAGEKTRISEKSKTKGSLKLKHQASVHILLINTIYILLKNVIKIVSNCKYYVCNLR